MSALTGRLCSTERLSGADETTAGTAKKTHSYGNIGIFLQIFDKSKAVSVGILSLKLVHKSSYLRSVIKVAINTHPLDVLTLCWMYIKKGTTSVAICEW